jgi:hypothetical protein
MSDDNMYPMYPVSDNERGQLANMLRSYGEASRNISPLVGLKLPPYVAEKFFRAADLLDIDNGVDIVSDALRHFAERALSCWEGSDADEAIEVMNQAASILDKN